MRVLISSTLFILMLASSCKSWDPSSISVRQDPIDPKLVNLETKVFWGKDSIEISKECAYHEECADHFVFQEVEKNLCAFSEESYGQIRISTKRTKYKIGIYYAVISGLTLTVANLFGMPYGIAKMEVQVDVEIVNNKGDVIAYYSEIGKAKNTAAYYYGYSLYIIEFKTEPEAISDALDKIRPQIQKDVERLNASLKSSGTI